MYAPGQGFPGTVQAAVTYTLTADSRLLIDLEATSDAPTPIAMGQHTYFNLDGVAAPGTVLEHQLLVNGCEHWHVPWKPSDAWEPH